jgi:hypothetical protein
MRIYAASPARRTVQMLGDLLLAGWVWLWVWTALAVRGATLSLAAPGREISTAGTGLAGKLRDAGRTVGDLPLVGDEARRPFDGAGDAADQIAAAGAAQVHAVESLAFWLGLCVAAVPILLAVGVYLPARWRFVRQASAGRRFVDTSDDLDLFALRALSRQPLHRLARISDDPAGAWRRRDADVVRQLAALELRESGLGVPDLSSQRAVSA